MIPHTIRKFVRKCICHLWFSFQDTCAALQALSEYARLSYNGGPNLSVKLSSAVDGTNRIFELDKDNSEVLQTTDIRVPNTMFVEAHGDGCALLQVRIIPVASLNYSCQFI